MCDKRAQATPLHLDPWLGDAMKNINNADIFGLANRSRYQKASESIDNLVLEAQGSVA